MLLGLSWSISGCDRGGSDSQPNTLSWLDGIRDQKIEEIQDHYKSLHKAAQGIVHDELMMDFFHEQLPADGESPAARKISPQRYHRLDSRFVRSYGNFYDLLFVAQNGFVFHSIKQESDHHTNLFTGRWKETALAMGMQNDPDLHFVDYEAYGPSAEPASFFVVPVDTDGKTLGWFLLQYASNTLNSILGDKTQLGRTGEVYLVNEKGLMLSDSRFVNQSTILEIALKDSSVRKVFSEGKGHTLATDYRGVSVFSSFASFDVLGTPWALFAEIDEEEILGQGFLGDVAGISEVLAEMARNRTVEICQAGGLPGTVDNQFRVDMGEVLRITDEQICWTPGVGPCTAISANYPGKFGYLLHLGPTDQVYGHDAMTQNFLGPNQTQHLAELIRRIYHFDLVPCDLNKVQFVVVATHRESLAGILKLLLEQGIGLSQIKFLYQPDANFVNVRLDQKSGSVQGEWVVTGSHPSRTHFDSRRQTDLGTLLQSHFRGQGALP